MPLLEVVFLSKYEKCNMEPSNHLLKFDPKIVAILKKMIEDKKIINDHLSRGGRISELEASGFRFIQLL